MRWLFWIAAGTTGYAYVGYIMWLWVRAHLRPWPVRRGAGEPMVSVLMVVRNEEAVLSDKLRNVLELDYPAERCRIVVVSDGSTDGTEAILREYAQDPRVHVMFNQLACGKACGLNDGMKQAMGDVIVFTDARQKIERDALHWMMENFADPEVGAVSGELMLGSPEAGETSSGMGLYWRIEKRLRELEAASGSVVGATGALYAVRRELVAEVPADTILDDVFIPMKVVHHGFRVVFDPRAKAWDSPDLGSEREFRRKVRTLTGNYQLLQLAPWLLSGRNAIRFEFVSHKLLRLVVPFALMALLLTSWFPEGLFYKTAFWSQIGFYGLSILGWTRWKLGPLSRLAATAFTFVALNAAAVAALANFVTGHKTDWTQTALRKEMRV
jgi:biofilm PGA synthesis N-glycosyltransferase PgaC